MKKSLSSFFRSYPAFSFGCIMVLFILIQSIFSFCTKIKCSGFTNEAFNEWFPYKEHQVLLFDNSSGATDSINISELFKTAPYENSGGFHSRPCRRTAWIQTKYRGIAGQMLSVDAIEGDSGAITNVTISLKQLVIHGFTLSDTGVTGGINRTHTSRFFPQFTLGTKTYANVQELQGDTTGLKQHGIFRFWLAKGNGLVGYEVFPSLERYVLR